MTKLDWLMEMQDRWATETNQWIDRYPGHFLLIMLALLIFVCH